MENNANTISIRSPEGEIGTVPKENLQAALEKGFTEPTPEQLHEYKESQIYGNQFFLSGLFGAYRGALPFGAGAKLLQLRGVTPEIQEKLKKYNPASSATGEIVGSFAPGVGLLKVAGKAGKLASGLTKLVGLGEDAGIAGKIASTAVRGAAEGAAFGAHNVANDAVLGDPNLVAQHALSEIGTSALWGAGISGGLGLAAATLPKGVEAAKGALGKIKESLGASAPMDAIKNAGKEAFAAVASPVSKIPKDKILEAFETIGKEEAPIKAQEFAESLQELHNQTDSALREAVNGFENFTPETQAAISDYLKSVDSTKNAGDFARQFMYKSKGELKIDPGKIETFLKNTKSAKGAKAADAFANYLDSSSNLLDHLSHEATLGISESEPDLELIKDLVSKNRATLEEQQHAALGNALLQHTEGRGGVGEFLGASAVGHLLGLPHGLVEGAAAVFEGLRNPIETIHKLGKLQQAVSRSAERIGKMAESLANSSSKIDIGAKGILASKLAATPNVKEYKKRTEQIEALNHDLGSTVDKLHANTAILDPHAPAVVGALRDTAGRAISFLSSKIHPLTAPGPLARPPEPSSAQIATFNRYYQAVENPLSVMQQTKNGTLTHEAIEALTVVHPALYNQMKQSVIKALSDNKKVKDLSYQRKLMLSLFLGQDLDGSTHPLSMQMNQEMLGISGAQAEAKEQAFIGTPKTTSKALGNLTTSERALTAQQSSAQRIGD